MIEDEIDDIKLENFGVFTIVRSDYLTKTSISLDLVRWSVFWSVYLLRVCHCWFYKAPSVQFLSFIDAFEQTVSSIADLSEIVFMGDFNLDPVNSAGNFRLFGESVGSFNLSLVESGPTRITATSSTTLDSFIVSDLVRVRELSIVPVSSIADHELVILDLDYLRTVEEPIVKYFRDFCRL
jgi:hypothetical protein